MTADNISRRALDAALPDGQVWNIAPGGQLDAVFDATANALEIFREAAADIANLRNPESSSELAQLEIDFGVMPNSALTSAARAAQLRGVIRSGRIANCDPDRLQAILTEAGFDVVVYRNEPAIDPAEIMMSVPNGTAGDGVTTGGSGVTAGYGPPGDSEFIVNGELYTLQTLNYTATAGDGTTTAGSGATAGQFDGMRTESKLYPCPTHPSRWPFVFIIAGNKDGAGFIDWNMCHAETLAWTAGGDAILSKVLTPHLQYRLRSLNVEASADSLSDPIGPYAEQILDTPLETEHTVRVTCWATRFLRAAMVVADKDGTWDEAGIVESDNSPDGVELSYTATNGVSGVRLYLEDGTSTSKSEGDAAAFADLIIDDTTFELAEVVDTHRQALRNLILRCKPLRTWCMLLAEYVEGEPIDERAIRAVSRSVTLNKRDPINIVVTRDVDFTSSQGIGVAEEITGSTTLTDDDKIELLVRDAPAGTVITLDPATEFVVPRLFRICNATDETVEIHADSGAVLAYLFPHSEAKLWLTDATTTDGTWEIIGVGASTAYEVDLSGDAKTTTSSCSAGSSVTGSISTYLAGGICHFLHVKALSACDDATIEFYRDAALTDQLFEYTSADPYTSPEFSFRVSWSLATRSGGLTSGLLYYKITNNSSTASAFEIELKLSGPSLGPVMLPTSPALSLSGAVQTRSVSITHEDTSPIEIGQSVAAGARTMRVMVDVTEVWESGATMSIGDTFDTDRLMTALQIDLQQIGPQWVSVRYLAPTSRTFLATVDHASSTTGEATVTIEFE